uniref:Uncharacterized protein n=1 Tax=Anguilla anguilla TaxID=7936 RepID=A0A0E9S5T3_ANGAN
MQNMRKKLPDRTITRKINIILDHKT